MEEGAEERRRGGMRHECRFGGMEAVRTLIAHGASLRARNKERVGIVEILSLFRGKDGKSPLPAAALSILDLVFDHDARLKTLVISSPLSGPSRKLDKPSLLVKELVDLISSSEKLSRRCLLKAHGAKPSS